MRAAFVIALSVLALGGCKKEKEPEVAAEPTVEAPPPNPAETVEISVRGNHSFTKVVAICTKGGPKMEGDIKKEMVTLTGLTGDCEIHFKPDGPSYGPVRGGTSVNCIGQDDGRMLCKGGQ
ncbi:MAG: hypothetical protein H6739_01680 [Alphaproteobacteria bacterium]|nr:hypothetical protein [Alphaproteobacteria bacterium]